jgi:hypothetical protein
MAAVVEENLFPVNTPTVTEVSESEEGSDVDSFNYADYSKYVPTELATELQAAFETKRFGWKSRARMLMRIDEYHNHIAALTENLSFERGPRSPRKIDPREGLRAFFNSRTDEQLQKACALYNVNYNSFANDKANLIEALCDEAVTE